MSAGLASAPGLKALRCVRIFEADQMRRKGGLFAVPTRGGVVPLQHMQTLWTQVIREDREKILAEGVSQDL